MLAGYARVSTDEQHLDLQLAALTEYGCDVVFRDHGCSGVDALRPGLLAALEALSPGDTFVVWRLDRLGRSLPDLIDRMARFD
uniref:recombinase family protein n=1 Tax=Paraburkholderia kururiensis TaxID=984307 RepID=UPI0018F5F236